MEFDIRPQELSELRKKNPEILILDVREPSEWQIANIGGIHIPLGDLSSRFQELDPDKELFVLCHHGVRSAHAVVFLRSQGFEKAKNIRGGIDAWSVTVDSGIPRY